MPGLVLHLLLARGQPAVQVGQRGVGQAGPATVGRHAVGRFVGTAVNKYGHTDTATFGYSATTGKQLGLDRHDANRGGGQIAVTPDGRSVVVAGLMNNGRSGGYLLASYNARTGATRWMKRAPATRYAPSIPVGLGIDPHGDTVFVGSTQFVGGFDTAAWSVADGTLLWTGSYARAKTAFDVAAFALSADGTRLFVTGSRGSGAGITAAYHT